MNRNTTVLVLCGLLLLADVLWVERAFAMRAEMSNAELAALIAGQLLMAMFLGSISSTILRKKYARQKKPVRRERVPAVLRPLRRLFVSVWS